MNKKWLVWMWIALMLLPNIALAVAGPFGGAVGDSDVAKKFLDNLFGPLTGAASENPFGELMQIYNSAMLTVGGILVFYTLAAGTLQTAHDGEMLGKKWSSIWIPIRTAVGAAVLMPTMQGFAVIQAIIVWLAIQGIGLANLMWGAFYQDPLKDAFYVPPSAAVQIQKVAEDILMSSVCSAAFGESENLAATHADAFQTPDFYGPSVGGTNLDGVYKFPPVKAGLGLCGSVITAPVTDTITSGIVQNASSITPNFRLIDETSLKAGLVEIHSQQTSAMMRRAAALAARIADNTATADEVTAYFDSVKTNYTQALSQRAKEIYDSKKSEMEGAMKAQVKEDGFALAGAYYMQIVHAQNTITRAVSQTPSTASGPGMGSFQASGSLGDRASEAALSGGIFSTTAAGIGSFIVNEYVGFGERRVIFERAAVLIGSAKKSSQTALQDVEDSANTRSWALRIVSWFVQDDGLGGAFGSEGAQVNQNPIIMAKNLGETMTGTAWAGFTIGSLALAIFGSGAIGFGTVYAGLLYGIFGMLLVPGAVMSTYVPMAPYIIWIGAFIGWLLLVIQGVIGAPIWAVAHLAPDGDGVVGRGGQGYMLVLSLVLRPALMIFGIAVSIVLMKPVGQLINTTFLGTFALSVEPGPFALTQMIAGCLIYAGFMIAIIHRVFALIHIIPDNILKWIGGSDNSLGQESQALSQISDGKVLAAMGGAKMTGDLSQNALQGVQRVNSDRQQKARDEHQRQEGQGERHETARSGMEDLAYRKGEKADSAVSKYASNPSPMNKLNAVDALQDAKQQRAANANQIAQQDMAMHAQAMKNGDPDADKKYGAQKNEAENFSSGYDAAVEAEAKNPGSGAINAFLEQQSSAVAAKKAANPNTPLSPLERQLCEWHKTNETEKSL